MATAAQRPRAEVIQVRKAVRWAGETLELTNQEVGTALGASARSVVRWREGENRPSASHVLAAERLLELAHSLDAVFGSDMERLHAWLHEPLPALSGRTPLRTIINGHTDKLLTVLANVDSGVFA